MSQSRKVIKKLVYKIFGENFYRKAYVRGKIRDIRTGANLEEEASFLRYFVTKDSSVLDIGANYGHYTAVLSELVPDGKVYAFEPVPFTFEVLRGIVSRLQLKNVVVRHVAVSDKEGEIEMTLPLLDFGGPNTGVAFIGKDDRQHATTVRVKTLKLDDQQFEGRIDFIKIDIEGHEPVAFRGMENLIHKNRPVILIEFSHPCLLRAGFKPADFANYLNQKMNYRFSKIQHKKLDLVSETDPADGYYFLIPSEKLESFNAVLAV